MNFDLPGDCPSGKECPVHFRISMEVKDSSLLMYQAVTYVGEYCILTGDNPKYISNPLLLLASIFEGVQPEDAYKTSLYKVGFEGTLYDLTVLEGELLAPERFVESGDFSSAEMHHRMMVGDAGDM